MRPKSLHGRGARAAFGSALCIAQRACIQRSVICPSFQTLDVAREVGDRAVEVLGSGWCAQRAVTAPGNASACTVKVSSSPSAQAGRGAGIA